MNKSEIINYMKSIIKDNSSKQGAMSHLFQFSLYTFPFIKNGENHSFIDQLATTLEEIDTHLQGYAKVKLDKIATLEKQVPEQIFQELAEVLVLYNFLLMVGTDKRSVELEPASKKNG
ncbi:hypothetical protein [Niallia taxi]|uniref:hypothetical protein n=1 Tax=Niallia taxi TaxID=2499688 RepID=UPI00300B22E4